MSILTRTSPFLDFSSAISNKNEKILIRTFLLYQLHNLFFDYFKEVMGNNENFLNYSFMECYMKDSKMIQLLIQRIVETGEYTLEGIAHYTNIPFEVILDVACGNNIHLSVTLWAKIVTLYIEVEPEVSRVLLERLLKMSNTTEFQFSLLLRNI